MDEQKVEGMKKQLEFEQQQQDGRINQLKEMLNPKLKEQRKPKAPELPTVLSHKKPVIKKPVVKKSKSKEVK